ncbi:MAG: RNA polymerase subunit sigma-70 [Bacilli bacterium]|nr:RNA polymerase subunit sigma-70 [Bacilli bacterium]
MTENEKQRILELRNSGLGYKAISNETGIAIGSVKSFLRRRNEEATRTVLLCKCCGLPLIQTKGHRQKKFCSNKCRMKWWKENKNLLKEDKMAIAICPTCGKEIKYYPSKNRKYCCWNCYIKSKKVVQDNE